MNTPSDRDATMRDIAGKLRQVADFLDPKATP